MRFMTAFVAAVAVAAPALAQDMAKPGTEVKVGESVVVPYIWAKMDKPVPVEVTVTEIEKGSIEDLKDFDVPAEMSDYLPYYVRYTWKNLSDQDLSHQSLGAFYIIDDRNQQQSGARTEGKRFEKCLPGGSIKDMTKDVTAEGCDIYMIHKDGALKSVIYKGTNPDGHDEVKAIYKDPIRWIPSEDAPKAEPAAEGKGKIVN